MKPVEQRHDFDCVASSLAALLELPIEQMPDFWKTTSDGHSMQRAIRRWLAARGWHWLYSKCEPYQMRELAGRKREPGDTWPPRGYWLGQTATVAQLRDERTTHLVVMRDRRPVFNPGGTTRELYEPDQWLIGMYLLVPLDPAAT